MKQKKLVSLVLVLSLVFAVFGGTAAFAADKDAAQIVINVAHPNPEGDPNYIAVEAGKAYIEEKSNGRITFQIFPNNTYGEQMNCVQAVRMGTLDIMCSGFNTDYYEPAGAIQGPFVFDSYEHWERFEDSDYCKELCEKVEEAAGYHILGVGHFGFREVMSTIEARTVEDFSHIKMRVVNQTPYPEAAEILGAVGTPIGLADVYMSLQTKVVDATENPVTQLFSMKFYEPTKYLILTDHMLAAQYWIQSNACYDKLSAEDQALLEETFDFIADKVEEVAMEGIDSATQTMVDNGIVVIDGIDKQQFRDRLDIILDKYPSWAEVYEKVGQL